MGLLNNQNIIGLGTQVGALSYLPLFNAYKTRVEADSGVVVSNVLTNSMYKMLEPTIDSIEFAWSGIAGSKLRTVGNLDYYTKIYDMGSTPNDATQTTEANQPYQKGDIAPAEHEGMYNPNGDTRYVEHDEISFAANEAWTVTTVLNWEGGNSNETVNLWCGNGGITTYTFSLIRGASNAIYISGSDYAKRFNTGNINRVIGKNAVISITYNGTQLLVYLDGVLFYTRTITDSFIFSRIYGNVSSIYSANGTINAHIIRSEALSATQVAAEADFLQTIYPEIPSVTIGTQDWATSNFDAVATPQGNVIAEVTEGANVENISGGDFESGLIGTLASDDETSTWTLNTTTPISGSQDGLLQVTSIGTNVNRPNLTIPLTRAIGELRVMLFSYKVNSGTCIVSGVSNGGVFLLKNETLSGTGVFSLYYTSAGIGAYTVYFNGTNLFNVQIDNISDEEVGWAGSQDLYDGLIAQGETVQTALEAAAMWCYYNNDSSLGVIYGKLYNWFAVSLLQADIDAYNTANPTAHWGAHVPTQAEFTTLQTYLGGSAVAGGKMKMIGTDYWNSPNTGADNSSGFTALGGGYRRDTDGVMLALTTACNFWGITEASGTQAVLAYLLSSNEAFSQANVSKPRGYSLRLIKD